MRRRPYYSPSAPRCACHAAIWQAYEARCEAYHASRETADSAEPEPEWPQRPEHADGYCDACRAALFAPGAVWPPEIWAHLNDQAARDYNPTRPLRPLKLPPTPKARTEAAAKWHARAVKAFSLGSDTDARIPAILGRPCSKARDWYIEATNGYTALLHHAPPLKPEPTINLIDGYGADWIDLPPAFHLALSRVKLLANERSEAITLTIGPGTVRLHTSNYEGEASETIDVSASRLLTPEYSCTLSAGYLDPACGIWPLRWYLRPPKQYDRAPSNRYERTDEDGRVRWTEELPQIFEPAGTDYRIAIMPMRV